MGLQEELQRRSVRDLCCSPVLLGELDPEDALVVANALKVLAEPTRLQLLSLIRTAPGGRSTTGVLAERLDLTQPTITHHLGALYEAGFVQRERDGRQTWYWVETAAVEAIRQLLAFDPVP